MKQATPLREGNSNMWTTVLFALLVASASAEYGWKPNTEYRYEVHSKTLASLHQVTDLYTGMLMKAQLVVKPKTSEHLIVEIPNAEYSHVKVNLPQGADKHIPQENLKYQGMPLTKQPFEVKLKKGVVDEIVINKDVPIWEVNVIKSIVSQLQVDTQGQRLIPSKLNMVPKDQNDVTAVYKIMEDTVEGECEVLYDISPLPKYVLTREPHLAPQPQLVGQGHFLDIVKTKNFTNCIYKPGYHYGLTGLTQWEPTANKMGTFLSRSSVSRVVISGSLQSYTIQSSVTTNEVILSPEIYNQEKGEVYSRVNLTLTSVHSSQGEQKECQNPQSIKSLVYDFNSPWTNDQEARRKWGDYRGPNQIKLGGASSSSSSSEESKERARQHMRRSGRSINEIPGTMYSNGKNYASASSESYEDISREEWHQEIPTMTHAPEIPFLPYFVGYMGHSIQHSKEVNVNQIVKKLTEEIAQELQEPRLVPEKNTLDRFTILTNVIRTMNVKQLQQATQELYTKTDFESETPISNRNYVWMTFRDAVAQAGTGPAFTIIKEWILNGQIKGEEAAQVIATLPETAVYPTAEYMKHFFELVKSEQVQHQEYLNTSAIQAFTTLVRKAQVDRNTIHNQYPVHTFGRPTPKEDRSVPDQYIPYFAQKLEQYVQEQDSQKIQVYIRALGNMAHPKILRVFEPYLEGKKPVSDYQRTLIVVSLHKLTKTHPRLARSVLYKTYANVGEVYQVRVAAVYNLMKTNPPASMLQRMARFTHEDPSHQVSAAVKSVIKGYASLTGKDKKEQSENALAALHLLTPKEYSIHYSYSNVTDYLVKGMKLGYTQILNHIGGENGLIPESVFYHLVRNVNGYKYVVDKFSGMVSSFGVLSDLLHDMVEFGDLEYQQGSGDSQTLEKIYNILNLEKRPNKQFEANFVFRWLGATRMGTFDNHTIEQYLQKFVGLLNKLQNTKNFHYQKMYNEYTMTIGMPTATGLPFVYTINTPTLVYYGAKVTVKTQQTRGSQGGNKVVIPDKYEVDAEYGLQYSTRTQSKITFITPFDHQHYVAGLDKNVQFYFPIKTKKSFDLENKRFKIEMLIDQNKEYNLFHFSTWPYISRHNILEFKPTAENSETHIIKVREPMKFQERFGPKTGLTFRIQGYTDKRYFDLKTLYDLIHRHNFLSVLSYPTHPATVQHTVLDVVFDPKESNCQSIVLTGAYLRGEEQNQGEEKGEGRTGNLAKPTKTEVNSQERLHEFLLRSKIGIKEAEPIAFDFGFEMKGGQPVQYVATVGYASSPVDPQDKLLVYLRRMVNNKNYEICWTGVNQMQQLPKANGIKALEMEPKSGLVAQVSFGERCQENGAQIEITGKYKRSDERKQYLQQLPLYNQAKNAIEKGYLLEPSVQRMAEEARILNDHHYNIKYQNVPEEFKNMTYKIYSFLRHSLYFYITENPFGGKTQQGQVEMTVQFSPDLETVRSQIHTPVGGINFQSVRVPKYIAKILTPRRMKDKYQVIGEAITRGKSKKTCNIDSNLIRTFGNTTYQTEVGKVWHVAMLSKPQQYQTKEKYEAGQKHAFAVLFRNTDSQEKEFKLILDDKESTIVEVQPEQGKVVVGVNGQKTPVSHDKVYRYQKDGRNGKKHTLVKYYQLQTGEVVLSAPHHGIKIMYLGKSIRIALEPKNTKLTTGLCGRRNGEKTYFITPQGYVLRKPEEFTATWALSEEGRIGELKKAAMENSRIRKNVILSNVVSEQDAGRANFLGRKYDKLETSGQDYDSSSSESKESRETLGYGRTTGGSTGCNTRRIITLEKGGKHCFSLEPHETCTPHCHPETTESRTGQFYCVEKSSTSEHWQKMIVRGANPDFRNKGTPEELTFEYPTKCTRN